MLLWARSFGSCSLGSCEQRALVSPFRLVRTRSINVAFYARADQEHLVPFTVSTHADEELGFSPFMLVQTRSVGIAFYARADQERWCPAV
ncbi:hypothetical protein ACFX19_017356 [Malus domestica]